MAGPAGPPARLGNRPPRSTGVRKGWLTTQRGQISLAMGRRDEAAAMDRLRVATGSFAEPARLETLHVGEQNEVRGPTEAPVISVAWMAPSQLRVRGG